jgi:hypothetical protein
LRSATREDFESKLGRQEYSIGKYRNVIRATIPITYIQDDTTAGKQEVAIEVEDEIKRNKTKFYLLLSFDVDYGVQQAMETKILPFIDENIEMFSTYSR